MNQGGDNRDWQTENSGSDKSNIAVIALHAKGMVALHGKT